MIDAGKLRARVAFEKRAEVDDGLGNTEGDFVEQFVVSAAIVPKLGGETVVASRLAGHNLVNVTIRQSLDARQIRPEWRGRNVRTGELLNIRSIIDPDGDKGQWLELLCEIGVAT
jgi:head-tail adaptor